VSEFRQALARFRDVVRQEGEQSESPWLQMILERQRQVSRLRLRWAAAAVIMLVLGTIPAYERVRQQHREAEQEEANALLFQQVNTGLARSAARAMTPLLNWAPPTAGSATVENQGEGR
jgi:hypothetical protein